MTGEIQCCSEESLSGLQRINRDVILCEVDDFHIILRRTSEKVVFVLFREKSRLDRNPSSRALIRLRYDGNTSSLMERVQKELSALKEENRVMASLGYKTGWFSLLDYYRPMGDVCVLLSRTIGCIYAYRQKTLLKRLSFDWKERSAPLFEFPAQKGFEVLETQRFPKKRFLPFAAVEFETQHYELEELSGMSDLLREAIVNRDVLKNV